MEKAIEQKFSDYPAKIRKLLLNIRRLIYEVANEESLGEVEEVLKWGQISYVIKTGSTFRIDWDKKTPDHYAVYFHCQTCLLETFRELYQDLFKYQGNRALIFDVSESLPHVEFKRCISMSLRYHRIKHLPLLGE